MILLLDTSTPVCRLLLVDGNTQFASEWQADRMLAKDLHVWLRDRLAEHGKAWTDIKGIGAFRGPGSFTGLRIGLTVLNTLADSLAIPIVGTSGGDWSEEALARLRSGQNDRIALPYYDRDANITTQRK